MAEVNVPVETLVTQYRCDVSDCNGEVVRDHDQKVAYMTDPMQFPHICNECGKEYVFTESYPKVGYRYLTEAP